MNAVLSHRISTYAVDNPITGQWITCGKPPHRIRSAICANTAVARCWCVSARWYAASAFARKVSDGAPDFAASSTRSRHFRPSLDACVAACCDFRQDSSCSASQRFRAIEDAGIGAGCCPTALRWPLARRTWLVTWTTEPRSNSSRSVSGRQSNCCETKRSTPARDQLMASSPPPPE